MQKRGVKLGIEIGTAIGYDGNPVIGIACFEQRRKHDAASRNPKQHNSIDLAGAENHCEICSSETAHAMFCHNYIRGFQA